MGVMTSASEQEQSPRPPWPSRLVRLYTLALMTIAALAMGIIVVVMGVQVFFRYALNDSLVWAEELCRYLLILMTFLLIGVAYQRGEMVGVHFFMDRLRPRVRDLVLIPVQLAVIAFLLTVSWYGYLFAAFNAAATMPAIDFILTAILRREVSQSISMYWLYLLIPLGCVLLTAHIAVALAGTVARVLRQQQAA